VNELPEDSVALSSLKPKLIPNVEVAFWKHDERGNFYLVRNLRNSKYLKLHESGKVALQLLDGTRTLGDLNENLKRMPMDFDVERFVRILARNAFLENLETKETVEKDSEPYSIKKIFLRGDSKIFQSVLSN
jgi:hypothetical protein